MLPEDLVYNTLISLIVLLTVIFVFVLSYTFWTRKKNKYWKRYEKKFRDYFLPMLFSFVEKEPDKEDADELIHKLTKRTEDISFFLELLDEMAKLLKGEDREKLNLLIEHPMFYQFYRKKLFSFFLQNKLLACLYFENMSSIDDRVSARLVTISRSGNLKLAFGATKALQASDNIIVRRNALINFLKREDISELMVSELLHSFHREGLKYQEVIAGALKDILIESGISADKKKVIVLYFAYENIFEEAEFLMEFLKKLQYSIAKAPLIRGLVEALGTLHVTEAAPIIREYMKIQDVELRQKCAKSLGLLGGEENLAFLTKMLVTIEFPVRKTILQILVENSDLGHMFIKEFLDTNRELYERIHQKGIRPEDLKEVDYNIYSTVEGIKIMLSKRVAGGHV